MGDGGIQPGGGCGHGDEGDGDVRELREAPRKEDVDDGGDGGEREGGPVGGTDVGDGAPDDIEEGRPRGDFEIDAEDFARLVDDDVDGGGGDVAGNDRAGDELDEVGDAEKSPDDEKKS